MAQKRTSVAFFNLAVELGVASNRFQEIGIVVPIAGFAGLALLELLAFDIVDRPAVAAQCQSALLTIEDYIGRLTVRHPNATQSLPGNRFSSLEIEGNDMGIGGLLVVLKTITAPGRSNVNGEIDAQSPAAQVEHVDTVVAQFAVAPVPEPVPVVVKVVG